MHLRTLFALAAILATPALAADPTPPEPINPQRWVRSDDYPRMEMAKGVQGVVRFALSIDTAGKVYRCDISVSSGSGPLDKRACDLMLEKGRFKPALDGAGQPIPAMWTRHVNWAVSRTDIPRARTADVSLDVKSLPGGAAFAELTLAQIIAADGKVESCAVTWSSKIPALDAQACAASAKFLTPAAMIDAGGAPIRGLKVSRILFRRAAAAGE